MVLGSGVGLNPAADTINNGGSYQYKTYKYLMGGELVIAPRSRSFGDCWGALNYAIRESIIQKKTVWMPEYIEQRERVGHLLCEQMAEIDAPEADVQIADKTMLNPIRIAVEEYPYQYFPTKHKWTPGSYGRICVQTDNYQVPSNCSRSFHLHERNALYEWLKGRNYVILGKSYSVSECASLAASSDLFIGIDSGMSHLCHSVGVPIFLLNWQALDKFHPHKIFLRFDKVSEVISIAESISKD
jgi:hypothetical protein